MLADFKKLLTARMLYNLGVTMQAVIIGWQMYVLTKDPLHLGLIGLAEAIPAIGIALYAGYVVDRGRPIFIYGNVILGSLISALVVFLTQSNFFALSVPTQVLSLYVASFITGAARGFSQPAVYAIVPKIVPRNDLSKAAAWTTSTLQIGRIAGPALGGLCFGFLGVATTSAIVAVFLLAGLISVWLMRASISAAASQGKLPQASLRENLFSGASFVLKHRILLPALSMDMISVLFGGVTALLPIFASEVLHTDARGLGFLRAAPAFGAFAMSYWLVKRNIKSRAGTWLFSSVFAFGLCILVFALSQSFWLSFGALFLSGVFDSVSMVVRSTAVQLVSPDNMRGRISAVNSIFIGSSNEIGEFESGVAAKLLGTVPSVVLGGIVCLLTVATVYGIAPALRTLNLEELEAATESRLR